MPLKFPVGIVIPFAGPLKEDQLKSSGWLPCDGRLLDKAQYSELFNVIGTKYGGDGVPNFYIPDLRGRFVRATDHGRGYDPDAQQRKATRSGAVTGDNTGSVQDFATGRPKNTFITNDQGNHNHSVDHLPTDYWNAACAITDNEGANFPGRTATSGEAGQHSHTIISGGDSESRPVNLYMYWIIKFTSADYDESMLLAAGSIVSFAGDAVNQNNDLIANGWLPCIGSAYEVSKYPELYENICNIYGGDQTNFNVPDLRGLFVRGVNSNTSDTSGVQGSTRVGQTEDYLTALPKTANFTLSTDGTHTHSAPKLPHDKYIENYCAGHEVANFPSGQVTDNNGNHTHVIAGGDAETRPVNIYLDYIIKSSNV